MKLYTKWISAVVVTALLSSSAAAMETKSQKRDFDGL